MADNVTLRASSGTFVARADDKGNGLVQVMALDAGSDGAENIIRAGQQSKPNSLPVALSSGQTGTHDSPVGTPPDLVMVGAVRQDADTSPVSADGDISYLTVNEKGRLKTAGSPAQYTPVTGNITAAAQTVSADVSQASNVMMYVTGTFAGHNCTFEGSIDGGTTWFGIQAVRSNANTIELATGVLAAAPAYAWELSVNALTNVRVRATAHTSGTATWRITLGSYATEPIPAVQTHAVTGSGFFLVQGGIPTIVADIASAALTTTTTTAAIVPSAGQGYQVVVPVTVVSGTNPTLDIVIQESDDTGTNWYDIYHFERITATGVYRSPKLPLTGNRIRYVQTVGGTTPSFTRSLSRLQLGAETVETVRRLFDRTLASTQTLSATTASLRMDNNCKNLQLIIAAGAITTTAPALRLQGSDDNGATWYDIGSPLTAVANSTVQSTVNNISAQLVRAIVTTAGSGATLTYVALKVF